MEVSTLLGILRRFKLSSAKKYGIKTLGLFGSFARNEQKDASDVDVVVTLEESDFFTLVAIREELEALIHMKVDVVNFRDTLKET